MSTTADIKNGLVISLDDQLVTITSFQHVKPGKGGAFVRTKLKGILSGRVLDKTFRSGEKIEIVRLDAREMQFLYREGADAVFMDQETFDQVSLSPEVVANNADYLKEGEIAKILFHGEVPLVIELDNFINYKIVECEPGVKGDTVSNVTKPATLESGAIVQVPLFVEEGETIRVDTRTGSYMERVRT